MVLTNPPFGKKSSYTIVNGDGKAWKDSQTYDRERLGATNWFCSLLGKYLYRNFESLEQYAESIKNEKFPLAEGVRLSKEDEMRRAMIRGLNSSVNKKIRNTCNIFDGTL